MRTLVAVLLVLVVLHLGVVVLKEADAPSILLNPGEPLAQDGVAVMMVCGEYPARDTPYRTVRDLLSPKAKFQYGRWTKRDRGECDVFYHHPFFEHDDDYGYEVENEEVLPCRRCAEQHLASESPTRIPLHERRSV
jgi:hypothetical protein